MIKKIHQLSKDENLDPDQLETQKLLIQHNPDYEYKLWTDEELEKIIHHHPKLQENWKNLVGIQKSDLGRYLVLYLEGGFYCDTDFYVNDSFDNLTLEDTIYFAPSVKDFIFMKNGITNYFIYSSPNKNFFIELIDYSLDRISKFNKTNPGYISNTTGKNLISYVMTKHKSDIKSFDNNKIINKYCSSTNIKDSFGYHDGGTSRPNKNKSWVNNNVISLINNECYMREKLHIKGNICQLPIVIIFISLFLLLLTVILIYKKYKK